MKYNKNIKRNFMCINDFDLKSIRLICLYENKKSKKFIMTIQDYLNILKIYFINIKISSNLKAIIFKLGYIKKNFVLNYFIISKFLIYNFIREDFIEIIPSIKNYDAFYNYFVYGYYKLLKYLFICKNKKYCLEKKKTFKKKKEIYENNSYKNLKKKKKKIIYFFNGKTEYQSFFKNETLVCKKLNIKVLKNKSIRCMDVSLNQRFIVYGDDIGNFYKIDKYKIDNYCFNRISTSDEIFNLVRFSKNSDVLASSTFSGKIFLWSINNNTLLKKFTTDNNLTSDIEFCEKDPIFFSCGENSLVYMWNCDRDYYIHMFKGHSKRINCINVHPSQDYFATCSYDKTVKFWDKRISKPVGNVILENLVIKSIKFTKDGNFLCFPDSSGQINFWDIRKDKNINRISNVNKKKNISHLEFNKFGNFLFYCMRDSNIIINSYSNGKYHCISKNIRVNNELLVLKYLNYNTLFIASYN